MKFSMAPQTPTWRNCKARKKNSVMVPNYFFYVIFGPGLEHITSPFRKEAFSWWMK